MNAAKKEEIIKIDGKTYRKVYLTDMSMAWADGFAYGRLVKAAKEGDKEAQRKLEEINNEGDTYFSLIEVNEEGTDIAD